MSKDTLIAMLHRFASQRPGLRFADYGNVTLYRHEQRRIAKDLQVARELLNVVAADPQITADHLVRELHSGHRLALEGGSLRYVTGQYFPVEFRPAVARVCAYALWAGALDAGHNPQQMLRRTLYGKISRAALRVVCDQQ